jgi:hypothetical protein
VKLRRFSGNTEESTAERHATPRAHGGPRVRRPTAFLYELRAPGDDGADLRAARALIWRRRSSSTARVSTNLRLDDDGRTEVHAIVDPDDVGVPHANAPPADGLTKKLRLRRAMDADGPSVAVRERHPALTERVLGPRRDPLQHARPIVRVDLVVVGMLDHLLDMESTGRRVVTLATDRDRE